MKIQETKEKIIKSLEDDGDEKSSFEIIFNTGNMDSEKIRECLEDGLGVEILEINERYISDEWIYNRNKK